LDEADPEFAHPGEYLMAVKTVAMYHEEDARLRRFKATGLSEGLPADGGYLVMPAMASGIMSHMYDVNQILGRVARDSVAGNSMTYNGVNETTHVGSIFGGVIPYWMGEGGTKISSKPAFWQLELKLKKLAALCYATDELLSDAPALQSWLVRSVPDALRFYAEEAIINGDGVGKPLGITQSPSLVTVLRVDANEVELTDIANMWARRWAGYSDYVWLVNPTVVPQLHIMTAATAPVYLPAGNAAGSPFGTLYGRPLIETEHCQALGTTGDIILASMSQYQTIDKGGIQAASSMHVAFTTDEMAYRFVYRIDGGSLWNSALTPVHGSTTFSPFVVLGASV
jgi:HK97 family phage major capsid protein